MHGSLKDYECFIIGMAVNLYLSVVLDGTAIPPMTLQ